MTKHMHRAAATEDLCWERPLVSEENLRRDPRADGNIVIRETCACGAIRETASNVGATERGVWRAPK